MTRRRFMFFVMFLPFVAKNFSNEREIITQSGEYLITQNELRLVAV